MKICARILVLTISLVATLALLNCSGSGDGNDPADTTIDDVAVTADVSLEETLPGEDSVAPDEDLVAPEEDIVEAADLAAPEDAAAELVEDVVEPSLLLADLEDLDLAAESFWNGEVGGGIFTSGQLSFLNLYNAEYFSWDGYSYANITDNTTPGYDNQYSAIPGTGADGTATYAVAHDGTGYGAQAPTFVVDYEMPVVIAGAYVTNTTYTYLSMAEGDDFAKKFGGVEGTDPDWFLVTFTGYDNDGEVTGTVEFYLADFQAETNAGDYIINEWTWVDLTPLGAVGEVRAVLTSSDMGEWGMNTPGYFAVDQIVAAEL